MNRGTNWFVRHTQQAVMARTATLPVIARTGPSNKSSSKQQKQKSKNPNDGIFIVGESRVGGEHVVGGTP
jgi:hypothetical protein